MIGKELFTLSQLLIFPRMLFNKIRKYSCNKMMKGIWESHAFFLYHSTKIRSSPVDTGRKLNVHKTFRRRPGRLLNVLCSFNLRPVSTGSRGVLKNSCSKRSEEYSQNFQENTNNCTHIF